MNNSSLTEMAAKAIGNAPEGFSPLTDDGDCARMEAQLSVCVEWSEAWVISWHGNVQQTVLFSTHNGDKNAARRVASVAVASEIGRMK